MFWIALELRNPKIGLFVGLSLLVIKLDTFRDGVVKSGNTGGRTLLPLIIQNIFLHICQETDVR